MRQYLKNELYRITCLVSDIDSAYHQASVKLGLSDSASFVLYMLYMNGGSCSLNEIYKLSGISKQTVHSSVCKLEKEGMVRLENLDGKAKQLCATDKGSAYLEQTGGRLFEAEYHAFRNWSEEELRSFIQLLEKFNASFKKQIEDL